MTADSGDFEEGEEGTGKWHASPNPEGLELEVEVRRGKRPMTSDECKDSNRAKTCRDIF